MFKPVSSQIDFPKLERDLLDFWYKEGIIEKYLQKNQDLDKKFSFLDGPITANNPMGVHHGWGRTYKDLWQRFYNMKGYKQRFQNGFDEQGLWVEVEVEKELGLKSKKDIENLVAGDEFKSLEKFINLCKERVKKYSVIQTEQSKRLGYFMDWDNSYHTSSDENNYWIWKYLKTVHEKGWLYKGRDSVPWCPRCGTAISQHEILTEEYKEIAHDTVFFKLPIVGQDNLYLLVWTTTPWTILANIAVGINSKYDYGIWKDRVSGEKFIFLHLGEERKPPERIRQKDNAVVSLEQWVMDETGRNLEHKENISITELLKLKYEAPFDNLELVQNARNENPKTFHSIVDAGEVVNDIEGTGLLHIAPGAGGEDFKLGVKYNLPVVAPIAEDATYVADLSDFSGQDAKEHPEIIIEYLKNFKSGKFLFKVQKITHRYPTCWRCKKELVWRVVDEWYIAMDRKDKSGKTYREQMIGVAKKVNWIPKWGLERELDWLRNMHDWLISKKRYWGLALPIWECNTCGNFEVIGSKDELKEKAIEGWEKFRGNSPHRPWIDNVKVKCSKCTQTVSRIPDVGNPWLDAGIVPFSTVPKDWFPADFITESFPGQFKNWFYSLIAMSTTLSGSNPFKNVLGFASVRDEKGEEMHKSKGNAIEFNEAAEKAGADIMRWLYLTQNPEVNLNFGYNPAANVKRRFYLILWNSYKFFVDYAIVNKWKCEDYKQVKTNLKLLDRWILAALTEVVLQVNEKLEEFDVAGASRAIENFVVSDFSTWYIRRSRERVGLEAAVIDRNVAFSVMFGVLVTLSKLLAPFIPFISEEIFKSLTGEESVHLQPFPLGDKDLLDKHLIKNVELIRKIAEKGHAKRKEAGIKLRQPLALLSYKLNERLSKELEQILSDELNVKVVEYKKSSRIEPELVLDTKITPELAKEGLARELVRQIQQLRKDQGLTLSDKTLLEATSWPEEFEAMILQNTASLSLKQGSQLKIIKVNPD